MLRGVCCHHNHHHRRRRCRRHSHSYNPQALWDIFVQSSNAVCIRPEFAAANSLLHKMTTTTRTRRDCVTALNLAPTSSMPSCMNQVRSRLHLHCCCRCCLCWRRLALSRSSPTNFITRRVRTASSTTTTTLMITCAHALKHTTVFIKLLSSCCYTFLSRQPQKPCCKSLRKLARTRTRCRYTTSCCCCSRTGYMRAKSIHTRALQDARSRHTQYGHLSSTKTTTTTPGEWGRVLFSAQQSIVDACECI